QVAVFIDYGKIDIRETSPLSLVKTGAARRSPPPQRTKREVNLNRLKPLPLPITSNSLIGSANSSDPLLAVRSSESDPRFSGRASDDTAIVKWHSGACDRRSNNVRLSVHNRHRRCTSALW